MMRVRVPNGDLTAAQLRALRETIAPYGDEVGCADVTTRAGIQLRGITLDDAGRVLDVLKASGITPIQSGMDNVRQVSSSRRVVERKRERERERERVFLLVSFDLKNLDLLLCFHLSALPPSLPPKTDHGIPHRRRRPPGAL